MRPLLLHLAAMAAGLLGAFPVPAQEPVPVATLDSNTILIGQQVRLDLSVEYRADGGTVNIQWPLIADTLTAEVPVLHDSHVDTILPEREKDPFLFRQVRTLTITSWDPGYWAIPPFAFVINGDTLLTGPLLLTVNTVAVDTTKAIRDIKEIYRVPFSLLEWLREHWPWLAGGLVVAALLTALFVVLYKRARRPKPVAPPAPPQPVHLRTLLALEALRQQQLWQQGRHKEYHSELTGILRAYIEERFAVPAMERTTDELLAGLRLSAMPRSQQERLEAVLRLADMVKFAKWNTLPAENEQALAAAIQLVQETADAPTHAPLA